MNILIEIIPAHARKYVYAIYALIGLILGAWSVAETPGWLVTALAVYAFVGTALGLTAASNTQPLDVLDAEVYDPDA